MHHSNFVHLHLHTQYSLLDGAIRHDALIKRALEFKMPAVAVTDHGNLFGAVEFYQKAMAKGVKPIIGCEVYVAPGSRTDKTTGARGSSEAAFHLVLLVKNAAGYRNLCKLLTSAYLEGFYYRPRIDKELLASHNEGLIALSACLHGEVSHLIATGQSESAVRAAQGYKDMFTNNRFYLEIQHNGIEEQNKVNAGLIEIGKKLKIPLVATNDCHYLNKEDARVHDVLLCIQTGTTVNATNRMRFSTDELYMKSPEEMTESFKDIPEAISNTIAIAERCNFEMKLDEHYLPEFPLSEGETLNSVIEARAKEGLERRLHTAIKPNAKDVDGVDLLYYGRLNKELKVIEGMGFPGYFLIVSDFINYAKKMGIPVGPGRGSAAGSLVAYALGITNIDPIEHNLLFERFLNPDRISLPDIDIDFCFEKRDAVIKYVTEKYGKDNVGQIITFGQMKAKACIRDVGRALDMPYGDVDKIAKLVPNQLDITIEKALEQEERLRKLVETDPRVKDLIEVAIALEGLPRHASTHAAGVVISNKPMTEYLPLYMSQKDNVVTTQYPMKDVEKIGLVKFDFLGLKTLTVIDKTLKLIKAQTGKSIDIETIPLDDAKTYELIANGVTNGIFQLESSGIKDMLRKLKPSVFEDVVAAVALYRPGPLQSGMVEDFINRKHKRTKITYEVPELEPILKNTYGVMVYQEQVMEIARVLAGYSPGEADVLRKAMGKKQPEVLLAQQNRFLDGAKKKEIPPKKAEKIFDLITKFGGYGFNKSHSAAYALITYQTAYLKAYYPREYMAALMSSDMGNTDQIVKYVNDCKDMGIMLLTPDVNRSSMEFTVEDGSIRFGLGAIKNVGEAAIEEILALRKDSAFASLVDFLSRVDGRKVNKKVIESLIKCGAFDSVAESRVHLLNTLETEMEIAQGVQRDRRDGQKSLFDALGGSSAVLAPPKSATNGLKAQETTEKEKLAFEKETLGFYFSSHPVAPYAKEIDAYTTCRFEGMMERQDASEVTAGGVVTDTKETTTKKGDRMAFLRLEDTTGFAEVVVFAEIYKKCREIITSGAPVIVTGKLDKDEEAMTIKIVATDIIALTDAKNSKKAKVKATQMTLPAAAIDEARLNELKAILRSSPGGSRVVVRIVGSDMTTVISLPEELKIDPADDFIARLKAVIPGSEVRVG